MKKPTPPETHREKKGLFVRRENPSIPAQMIVISNLTLR